MGASHIVGLWMGEVGMAANGQRLGRMGWWQKRPFFLLTLWLMGCGLRVQPVTMPEAVLTAVSRQLSPDAIVLLPAAASHDGLTTVDLDSMDKTSLRDLLRNSTSLYLLFDPDALGVYGKTAVANIEWVQNHSQPVELDQYDGGLVLYWVVVPPESLFETPGLLVAPGS